MGLAWKEEGAFERPSVYPSKDHLMFEEEGETYQKVASMRIHLERVIECAKKLEHFDAVVVTLSAPE